MKITETDFINYVFYGLSNYLAIFLHNLKIGVTPNSITIFRFFCSLLGSFLIYKEYYITGASLVLFDRFLDCTDGLYAKKYNMITKGGDVLEHVIDWVSQIIFFIVMLIKLEEKKFILIPIFLLLTLTMGTACDNIRQNKTGIIQKINCVFCPTKHVDSFTKIIGEGFSNVFIFVFAAFFVKRL